MPTDGPVQLGNHERAIYVLGTARDAAKQIVKQYVGPAVARRRPTRTDLPLDLWGLRIGRNQRLWHGSIDLHELAERFGSPLHVVDGARLGAAANDALAPCREGAGADIFYSYKTNPVPAVLRRLHAAGIGAEVISAYELWLAFELGVPADRIIYNGPAKSPESIELAIRRGVHLVNANSLSELRTIVEIAERCATTVRLGLRVSFPGMWGGQFGIDAESTQVDEAIRVAQQSDVVDLVGVHVHRGGTMRGEGEWQWHVSTVLDFCAGVTERTGWSPTVLDVGGSLACPTSAGIGDRDYRLHRALGTDLIPPDPATAISIAQASRSATAMAAEHFGDRGCVVPAVVQEPGRALTGGSQMLLTRVLDVKDDVEPHHLVLDGGRNIADPLPHEYHQLFSVSKPSEPAARPYRLVGPICTPADVLYYHWALPNAAVGDVVAVMDAGAYFVPFSTSFSFPRPPIVVIDGDDVVLARTAESFDDLTALDRAAEERPR
ncbi:diaminopimelate decarboxylase family protein [Ilumatobacter sp.]|uniref:diaminopimelate decarboxylase family protein n=1 Tax=Ilumatobacter sp. TaxID=1967498 RepID=UPI003AF6BF33